MITLLNKDNVLYIIITIILLIASYQDIRHRRIPNRLVLAGFIIGILLIIIPGQPAAEELLMGLFYGGSIMLILYIISRGRMAAGDVKLVALTGLFIGKMILFAFIFTSIIAIIINLGLILVGKMKIKDSFPYGPYLSVGVFITLYLNNVLK